MLKHKEYRVCDRCFQELDENGHVEISCGADMRWYDLCETCYTDYMTYSDELVDLDNERHKIAEKYKFGPYLPREDKDDRKS